MERWIIAAAIFACGGHPLLGQTQLEQELAIPSQLPQLGVAQMGVNGAFSLELFRFDPMGTQQKSATEEYEVQVPYVVKLEKQYTVQVPYQETVVSDDGTSKKVTRMREEQRTRVVPVTKLRAEKRTRLVTVVDGSSDERGDSGVSGSRDVSRSTRNMQVKLDDVRFFSPRGDVVDGRIASRQLKRRQPIVFLGREETISPYFQRLVHPETLIVQLKQN